MDWRPLSFPGPGERAPAAAAQHVSQSAESEGEVKLRTSLPVPLNIAHMQQVDSSAADSDPAEPRIAAGVRGRALQGARSAREARASTAVCIAVGGVVCGRQAWTGLRLTSVLTQSRGNKPGH